ncbi:MAG: ATP-dependent DNA helicase RecG [Bacteroidales bacterium]|nr:ATP-dependent DNA helicase RecG [Bacteroidales bacterium]MBN2818754.1 ATP-dependent DNA helicase RecG [Bacteroidales bacterium]
MSSYLDTDIMYLKGVGPKRSEVLKKELNINTFRDLLYHFPFKYLDRSKFHRISEINATNAYIQIKGKITSFRTEGTKYKKRLFAKFADETGTIELVWFQGINWVTKNYNVGGEYIVFGKPAVYNRKISIAHPELEPLERTSPTSRSAFEPQYHTTEKMKASYLNSKAIQVLIFKIISSPEFNIEETLPDYILGKEKLTPLKQTIRCIHFPNNTDELKKAEYRLKFEELFYIQLSILRLKTGRENKIKGFVFGRVAELFNEFYKEYLPFELTNAQKRVVKEIRHDVGSGKQMNRLLQGDVGSGKTLVALLSMLIALDNGFQACMMAPTEILAQQHYNTLTRMLNGMDVNIMLLTGSTKKKDREVLHAELTSGRLHILIGTHALIEDSVIFSNLGLVIIDEQHRFGVAQRAKLWQKNEHPPHVLVMTATPIPRTLAMTLYGDLDVSVIDELPPGRKPIQTYHFRDSKRLAMYGFLRKQIDMGRQVYVVYPLIKESEKLDLQNLENGFDGMVQVFSPPNYNVICVHGKLKPQEKETAMTVFKNAKAHILMATTVIEVGVDVPNATVMVIESAERFGLSQLHQLRGRVGRGADQSYCILMSSNKLTNEARKRLEVMIATNDGFEIAEADLKLRGPGDIEGTQQSGVPFVLKMANIARDGQILQYVRNIADTILELDPLLEKTENAILSAQLKVMKQNIDDWSQIS